MTWQGGIEDKANRAHGSGKSRFGQELGDQRAEGVADFG
jgi:hypothetical protein